MTWSYTDTLLTAKDQVRFLSGDTQITSQMVTNEEITGILALYGNNVFRGAAAVCRHLASRFSRQADAAIDDMRKSLSQRAAAFAARAQELEAQADNGSVIGTLVPQVFAGGIFESDVETNRQDDSIVQPMFTRDMMEFPTGFRSVETSEEED